MFYPMDAAEHAEHVIGSEEGSIVSEKTAAIILSEWRKNIKAICDGNDPLEKPGGVVAYTQLFDGPDQVLVGRANWRELPRASA